MGSKYKILFSRPQKGTFFCETTSFDVFIVKIGAGVLAEDKAKDWQSKAEAKAKDWWPKAQAKTKDLEPKAKAKDW